MPAQQKALLLPKKQGDWVVGTTEVPKPGPGQLLVKIEATALNPVDWKIQVYGLFIENFPAILGSDAAGTVEEVGEGVTGFAPGDKVVFQGFFVNPQATFQQYALSNADVTAKIPGNITVDQASTLPLGLATAALGLFDAGSAGLSPAPWEAGGRGKFSGKPFVVFGGAASVGQYAIQLAKLAGFSPIIATASLKNTPLLESLGATHVLDRNLSPDALLAEVNKITAGAPVEVVYDAVSIPETQTPAFDVLAPGGTLVLVLPDQIDAAKKAAAPEKKVVGVFGNVNAPDMRKTGQSLYAKLPALLESGEIKPNPVDLLPDGLAGIPGGLKRMERNEVSAVKLVARPQETP
ncbi:GroES-like protein [Obba rivulosa]|uniref:GroES-like protein n=1 Tax=Obba rivulosa TaxID=1052685 RepID=A0A8E2AUH4_9APHY|nr:GroES-like protein [Obba rivulosa]